MMVELPSRGRARRRVTGPRGEWVSVFGPRTQEDRLGGSGELFLRGDECARGRPPELAQQPRSPRDAARSNVTAKPDIIWFLLDGVRPDRLRSCGGEVGQRVFIDEVLDTGTLFTNTIAAGPYSLIALNSLFTSLYATTNGVNGAYKTTVEDLHPEAVTLTDILKREGYSTLCYAGSPFEPVEPVPSFDVYELKPELDDSVFEAYATAPAPRFLSLSFQHVHDACCDAPQEMTAANFERAIRELSAEFERFYRRLVGPNTLAMVFSDHGMRLRERADPDWDWEAHPELEPTTGVYVTDNTIRTFTALVHSGLFPVRKIHEQIRSIDVVPTLLEALGFSEIGGQGVSLWPEIENGTAMPERIAFSETGGRWFSPWEPNVRCVRTNRFKFTRHEALGEALYDLELDPAEEQNRIGCGLAQEEMLRKALGAQLEAIRRAPGEIYAASGVNHRALLEARPPPPAVPELSKAMNAYEGITGALADENCDEAAKHAQSFVQLAEREADKAEDAGERNAYLYVRDVAQPLCSAAEVGPAREIYGRVSELLIAFIGGRPLFAESLVAYECPEAVGYKRWVQKRNDDKLVNPYLGRASNATVREIEFSS